MWKSRIQSTSSGSKTVGQTKSSTLQNLSPFASHSSVDPLARSSSISPKTGPELPTGVRYIRQNPSTLYRPITARSTTPTAAKQRGKSPEKTLRFADPLMCTKKHDRTEPPKTVVKQRSTSKDRSRPLIRPVISAETTDNKRYASHSKTVATSPATRQTSPIFSTVDFGGDTKRSSNSTPTMSSKHYSNANPIHISKDEVTTDAIDSNPKPNIRNDRQPFIKTEISTPNGTVLKRSSAVSSKMGTNGTIHRNTVSFPITSTINRNSDQNRLSVNVNVAVGLNCSDSQNNHFDEQRYSNLMDTEYNAIDQIGEDVVDWRPSIDTDDSFALKVAVRLRPFVQSEVDSRNNIPAIEMNGKTVRIINSDNDNYNRMEYGFDICLNSSDRDRFDYADQEIVYRRVGEPLLERALEGYNVCLFAYGQTGSGKSYTITGTDTNPGIIPRFVHDLYKKMLNLTEVLFAVEISYYEIYNEKIYDLLSDDKNHNKKILRIREHPQTGPYVENLTQHTVEEYDEVIHLLRSGGKRRATASTAANADSSRSHSIFTLILSQLKNNSEQLDLDMSCSCGSRINLIDLAGSERIGISGTSGDRLKEGSLINKSLLNLGKVISKLADYSQNPMKATHIPYRDSALSWLLKESLGGNSQTSMIATISPAKCHLEETMSTLRYAAIARRIVNYVHINEDPKTKKIRELMEIIADLKSKQTHISVEPKDIAVGGLSFSSFEDSFGSNTNKTIKSVDKISKATNTSFIETRTTNTKEVNTSFVEPVVEQPKKSTVSIATNTSFIKPTNTRSCSTETPPQKPKPSTKPKTVSTATEMSFVEVVNTATETQFVELPSRLDLLRFQKLEEQQKKLLEDIRKHKEKILSEVTNKVDEWSHVSYGKTLNNEELTDKSDSVSNYYDCEEVIENASIDSSQTYTISKDTVDNKSKWDNIVVNTKVVDKQTSDKKNKKKSKSPAKKDIWNSVEKRSVIKNDTIEDKDKKQDNWNQLQQREVKKTSQTNDTEWSVQPNDDKKKTDKTTDDWGQQTQTQDNNEWGTDTQNNNWNTEEKNNIEDNANDWDAEQKNTVEDNGNDWNTDQMNTTEVNANEWDSEQKNTAEDNNNYWGSDDKTNDQNWSNDQNNTEDNSKGWDTEQTNVTEDKATDWTQTEPSVRKKDKKKDKKKKKKDKENEDNEWANDDQINQITVKSTAQDNNEWSEEPKKGDNQKTADDWQTEEPKKSDQKEEDKWDDNEWGTDTVDNKQDTKDQTGDADQFDWGADNTADTTVIDVKHESTDWETPAVEEDIW